MRWRAGTTDAVVFGANKEHAEQLHQEFIRVFNNSRFISISVFPLPKGFPALVWSFGSCRIFFESEALENRLMLGKIYKIHKFYDHYAEEERFRRLESALDGGPSYREPQRRTYDEKIPYIP